MWLFVAITVAAGYLLGNLNGAICASKALGDDVRTHGSGNAGLTNFIRSYGASHALLVIVIDAGKAVVGCLIGGFLLKNHLGFQPGAILGGSAVMLGHVFPAFLGFRGGKGILSGFFIALVVDYRVALIILAIFAVAYALTGYVSLGSVLGALTLSVAFAILYFENYVMVGCGIFMGALAIFMHRQNIVRLLKGKESKTNLFKK